MNRYLLLFLIFSQLHLNAQEVDKGSLYGSLIINSASGEYKNYLQKYSEGTTKVGGCFGYLFNIQQKAGVSSPIQIGAEFGIESWGKDRVTSQVNGSFTNNHNAFWLNAVARFRPILTASTVNPFLDLAVGPKFIHSSVTEIFSNQETQKILGVTKTAKNFVIGGGVGFKKEKRNQKLQYVDIGVYYQYADKVRSIRRNSVFITPDGVTDYAETIIKPSTVQVRIGLTGFL
jgi:hypothetical protein